MKNWAGNTTYSTDRVLAPRSVAEAQEMVARSDVLRALGTRHSFSRVADTSGVLLSTEHLNSIVEVGERNVVALDGGRDRSRLGEVHGADRKLFRRDPGRRARHPIAGADPMHTTEQLGVPGPSVALAQPLSRARQHLHSLHLEAARRESSGGAATR
jgi:hypothetical protein